MFWTWKRKRTLRQALNHLYEARNYLLKLAEDAAYVDGNFEETVFLNEEMTKVRELIPALRRKLEES